MLFVPDVFLFVVLSNVDVYLFPLWPVARPDFFLMMLVLFLWIKVLIHLG